MLGRRLNRNRFETRAASSGLEALAALQEDSFDIVLLDVMMPNLDGFETLRRIRSRWNSGELPVIMATANDESENVVAALEDGANDYVTKPFDFPVLLARISVNVDRKKAEEQVKSTLDTLEATVDARTAALRQAHDELVAREAQMSAILDNAADAIVCIDTDGSIRTFNSAAQSIFGFSEKEVIGRNASVLMPDDYALLHGDFLKGTMEGQSLKLGIVGAGVRELEGKRKNGSVFPIEVSLGESRTARNHMIVGVIRDITERKAFQQALHAADEQVRLLMASVGDGVYGIDRSGETTFVNPAALSMLGYRQNEVIGRNAHRLFHHSRADGLEYPAHECPIEETLNIGTRQDVEDEVFWRKDGSQMPVEFTSMPLMKDGDIVGAVVSFRDISERKEMEAKFRQTHKMEAVGRLTGGVAHDFNNLLTVIMGNLQLLERSLGDNEQPLSRIRKVMQAAKSGAELTRTLLTFSRQQVFETRAVDVNEMVQDMEKLLHRTLGAEIILTPVLSEEECFGRTDKNQLEHALLNLCINARDAMPNGGTLTIGTRRTSLSRGCAELKDEVPPGDYIEISVTDTGTGMTADVMEKIFEPFFTTKEAGKGTGLGLSSTFGFMKQSGGHISVSSEVGSGTTFRLYVPLAAKSAEPDAITPEDSIVRATKQRHTVLVVEDDPNVRDIAVSVLSDAGYRIVEANTGVKGLSAFQENEASIDLVFSDVIMPGGLTGPEMVEKIRGRKAGIPVVFASGYAEQALRNREDTLRGVEFIAKPYDAKVLLRKIQSILTN